MVGLGWPLAEAPRLALAEVRAVGGDVMAVGGPRPDASTGWGTPSGQRAPPCGAPLPSGLRRPTGLDRRRGDARREKCFGDARPSVGGASRVAFRAPVSWAGPGLWREKDPGR
jgi:hypothetical protein